MMTEEVTTFGRQSLQGILTRSAPGKGFGLPGIILLSPGLLHRVGPNRMYVKLARSLSVDGFNVLRFDFSGRGDSLPRTDHLPLQKSSVEETREAIDHMASECGCSDVILIGHCSGASFSLMTAFEDERVIGAVAVSPESGDDDWVEFDRRKKEARYYANYYSRSAVTDTGRWRRLLTGKADYGSIVRNVARNMIWYRVSLLKYMLRTRTGSSAKAAGARDDIREFKEGLRKLGDRHMPVLLIHPDQSAGRELIRAMLGDAMARMQEAGDLKVELITNSDHMFTPLAAQHEFIDTVRNWVVNVGASSRTPAAVAAGSD